MERKTDCVFRLDAERFDYSQGGCKHSKMEGFICMAFASERTAIWMVGLPDGCMCEMYANKDDVMERTYNKMGEKGEE